MQTLKVKEGSRCCLPEKNFCFLLGIPDILKLKAEQKTAVLPGKAV